MRQPVEFTPRMALDEPRCASWLRPMGWLYNECEQDCPRGDEMLESSLFAAQIEEMVIATLLLTQPHSYSEHLADDTPSIAPYYVKGAASFIAENAHEPLTTGEIVGHVGGARVYFFPASESIGIGPPWRI